MAISQEDTSLTEFAKILEALPEDPPFTMLADLDRRATPRYARTTAYLIDEEGRVLQVFPMETYHRPSWWAVLDEIDRQLADDPDEEATIK